MKKIAICLVFLSAAMASMAQIQRTPAAKTDSSGTGTNTEMRQGRGGGQMQLFRELNLTREQKMKLRDIRQGNKAKKEAIDNDTALTDADRQQKLKQLRKDQLMATMAILTDEQKQKLKELKGAKGDAEMQLGDN